MKLRFTIRDLLWLTAVVALAVAWVIDHWANRPSFREELLQNEIKQLEVMLTKTQTLLLEEHQSHPAVPQTD